MIESKINLAGVDCAIAEWNPGAKRRVFALHGWLDNLATFEKLAAHMPDIHLVAVDFPGHGHSAHLPKGSIYHFIDGIYLIADLANHFAEERIRLLGHSMGGAVASLFAAAKPEQVAGLVMIESLGPLTTSPEESAALLSAALDQRKLQQNKSKPVYSRYSQALAARAMASKIAQQAIEPIVERGLRQVDGGYTWRADARLRVSSPFRLSEPQLQAILKSVSAPVMLIQGSEGFFQDTALAEPRQTLFKRLRLQQLQGGHHVHLECPMETAQLISAFFKDLD